MKGHHDVVQFTVDWAKWPLARSEACNFVDLSDMPACSIFYPQKIRPIWWWDGSSLPIGSEFLRKKSSTHVGKQL